MPSPLLLDALVERNYGEVEGLDWVQVEHDFANGADVPGRESREEVAARVVPALISLAAEHPDQSLVIVSHGGAIRAVLNHVQPNTNHGTITNGSVHSFRLADGGLELIAFDDPIDLESIANDDVDVDVDVDDQNAIEAMEETG